MPVFGLGSHGALAVPQPPHRRYHLRTVKAKLGIASRAQLGQLDLEGDGPRWRPEACPHHVLTGA
jgi:hypothetical protein